MSLRGALGASCSRRARRSCSRRCSTRRGCARRRRSSRQGVAARRRARAHAAARRRQPRLHLDDAAARAAGRDRPRRTRTGSTRRCISTLPPPAASATGRRSRRPPARRRSPRRRTPPRPAFTAARPLRVWVAGDSLARCPARRSSASAAPCARRRRRREPGLDRARRGPTLYNWYTRFRAGDPRPAPGRRRAFVRRQRRARLHGRRPAGQVGPLGSPSWDAEYRRRVEGVTREFNAAGVYVVWLGLPIPDEQRLTSTVSRSSTTSFGAASRATGSALRTSTRGTCSTTDTAATRRTSAARTGA